MRVLFYDKETTGLPLFDQPSDDPRQPHIVQAAAILAEAETGQVLQSIDLVAYPDGWTIPDEVAAIHGITTEKGKAVGVPERLIVDTILCLHDRADLRVAHNESFDARIMRIALKRFRDDAAADHWKQGKADCTMKLARPIMQLPKGKAPNLREAYEHFTGQPLQDAHTAMADARACMDVWLAILKTQAQEWFDTAPHAVAPPKPKPPAAADGVSFLS